jgi:hypothetical protein
MQLNLSALEDADDASSSSPGVAAASSALRLARACAAGTPLLDLLQCAATALSALRAAPAAWWLQQPVASRAAGAACARGVDAAAMALVFHLDTVLERLALGSGVDDDEDESALPLPLTAGGGGGGAFFAASAAAVLQARQSATIPPHAATFSLDAHVDFWRERADVVARWGSVLGRALDLWEGGPADWLDLALIQPARALWAALHGSDSAAALGDDNDDAVAAAVAAGSSASPGEKAARLSALRLALAHLLGVTRRALVDAAAAGAATDDDDEALPFPAARCERRLVPLLGAVLCSGGGGDDGAPAPLPQASASSEIVVAAAVDRLQRVLATLSAAALGLPALSARVRSRAYALAARSAWHRQWLRSGAAGAAVAAGVYLAVWRGDDVSAWARTAAASVAAFYAEHVAAPLREMAGELLSGRRGAVADPAALDDARASLQAMLVAFSAKLAASPARLAALSPDARAVAARQAADAASVGGEAALAACDMRAVSERFVAEVDRPLANAVSGDLVQLLLIQVAFIKKEVLAAMAAMDAILADNRFNLQLSAMLPAAVVVYGAGAGVAALVSSARAPIDTAAAEARVRLLLRDAHRLLAFAGSPAVVATAADGAVMTSDGAAEVLWSDAAWLRRASALAASDKVSVDCADVLSAGQGDTPYKASNVGTNRAAGHSGDAVRAWQHGGMRPALAAIVIMLARRVADVSAALLLRSPTSTPAPVVPTTGLAGMIERNALVFEHLTPKVPAPADRATFLPSLVAADVGQLLLWQQQLRALTRDLQGNGSISFTEGWRLQQDLEDLGAIATPLLARMKTAERLLRDRHW